QHNTYYPAFVPFFSKYDNKCGQKETKARTFSRDCLRIWRFWKQTRDKRNKRMQKYTNANKKGF
ncbi:hypothetical protein, partial [Gardnerella vaginalis]|uniref:hypothetical protein n=1 Tax=Gardnerella vaginalis TaxID=2702 RepID=UPI001C718766